MKDNIRDRVLKHARMFLSRDIKNIRQLANITKYSKTTVHIDLTERLKKIHPELYSKVAEKIIFNKKSRHLRGGQATKELWRKRKK